MYDALIIGGGLAGLVNGIQLSRQKWKVLLIEKNVYPFHRVCGEYISNEATLFLKKIGCYPEELRPATIQKFQLSAPNGLFLELPLKLGGFGISRFSYDHWLAKRAIEAGVELVEGIKVDGINFESDRFQVELSNGHWVESKVVLGCQGKRSLIDKFLHRPFLKHRSPYIGVKKHLELDYPDGLIALHNFRGGYCGISQVENGIVNLAYLCEREKLKMAGSIPNLEQNVLCKNPHLDTIFKTSKTTFRQPMVINEISFATKEPVNSHVLMAGDAVGMISPLCGNGMAMAIHSAKLCSSLVNDYLSKNIDRTKLESTYSDQWAKLFNHRLRRGRWLQKLFGNSINPQLTIKICSLFPALGQALISQSHGEPF